MRNKKLLEFSTAYVKDGFLIKWRKDSEDLESLEHQLNKSINTLLTEDELTYVKTLENVIIETDGELDIINFSMYGLEL